MSQDIYLKYSETLRGQKEFYLSGKLPPYIIYTLENQLKELVEGFLERRLERDFVSDQGKDGTRISFLVEDKEIIDRFIAPYEGLQLATQLRKGIREVLEKASPVSIFNELEKTVTESKIFSFSLKMDFYSKDFRRFHFYYELGNLELEEQYQKFYQTDLLPRLHQVYKKSMQSYLDRGPIPLCSGEDFASEHAFKVISISNIERLLEKVIQSIEGGRRVVSPDSILLCLQSWVVIHVIKNSVGYKEKVEQIDNPVKDTHVVSEDDAVRSLILRILRGSVKQEKFVGFFTQNDYISWVESRHPNFSREKIEKIFKSVTWPSTPVGVIRFSISATETRPKRVYFTAFESVPRIFSGMQKKGKFSIMEDGIERDFMLFLRKLFKDFYDRNYTESKIASLLKCETEFFRSMKQNFQKWESQGGLSQKSKKI